jgi:hypothetical protein
MGSSNSGIPDSSDENGLPDPRSTKTSMAAMAAQDENSIITDAAKPGCQLD